MRLGLVWSIASILTCCSATSQEFQRNWCRQRLIRIDWQRVLKPCEGNTKWGVNKWPSDMATDAKKSRIAYLDLRPVGEYSKVFIESVDTLGRVKGIGGDSWRIFIKGQTSMEATVFDHRNGTYEGVFLLMEPGNYVIRAILEYSLCNGFKDPPLDWFIKGDVQGNLQAKYSKSGDSLGGVRDYLFEPLEEAPQFSIKDNQWKYREFDGLDITCGIPCKFLWDGFGRWSANKYGNFIWKPYIVKPFSNMRKIHSRGQGTLGIYGDSHSMYWFKSLVGSPLCTRTFHGCKNTYNWVYRLNYVNGRWNKHNLDKDWADFDVYRVMREFREEMDKFGVKQDSESAAVVNAGLHYAKSISFEKYKILIYDLARIISREFKGQAVWKTTTSVFKQVNPYAGSVRRFQTNQRSILFNAFANSAMCEKQIPILDVYQLSSAYPDQPGTSRSMGDPIHFNERVFVPVQYLLLDYFSSQVTPYKMKLAQFLQEQLLEEASAKDFWNNWDKRSFFQKINDKLLKLQQ